MTAVCDPSVFALRGGLRLKALKACLGSKLVVRKDTALSCEHTLLDSFDWRLYAAGAALEHRVAAGAPSLVWETLAGAEIQVASPAREAPRLATDLPAGPLRERLGPLLGPRRCCPR